MKKRDFMNKINETLRAVRVQISVTKKEYDKSSGSKKQELSQQLYTLKKEEAKLLNKLKG